MITAMIWIPLIYKDHIMCFKMTQPRQFSILSKKNNDLHKKNLLEGFWLWRGNRSKSVDEIGTKEKGFQIGKAGF